jgi:hypothetical protein
MTDKLNQWPKNSSNSNHSKTTRWDLTPWDAIEFACVCSRNTSPYESGRKTGNQLPYTHKYPYLIQEITPFLPYLFLGTLPRYPKEALPSESADS